MSGPKGSRVEVENISRDYSPGALAAYGLVRKGNRVVADDDDSDLAFVFVPGHPDHNPNIKDEEAERWYGRIHELPMQELE